MDRVFPLAVAGALWAGCARWSPADSGASGYAGDAQSDEHPCGQRPTERPALMELPLDSFDQIFDGEGSLSASYRSVSGVGDLDGDGFEEVAIGLSNAGLAGDQSGAVAVFSGPTGPWGVATDADLLLTGAQEWDRLGASVACAGDVDGDGVPDLLVGATGLDDERGGAYLLLGSELEGSGLDGARAIIVGEDTEARLGTSLASAGDLDGDGLDDLAIASPFDDSLAVDGGAVHLFTGAPAGVLGPDDATTSWYGPLEDGRAGMTVIAAGDLGGDGHDDLVIAAPAGGYEVVGVVYVLHGSLGAGRFDLADAGYQVSAGDEGSYLGWGTAVQAAMTHDGDPGIVVSDHVATSLRGVVYLFPAPLDGIVGLSEASASLSGEYPADVAGWDLVGGDFDGDGCSDMAISALQYDGGGEGVQTGGAAYVVLGPLAGELSLGEAGLRIEDPERLYTDVAYRLAVLGDPDGDGRDDLALFAKEDGDWTVHVLFGDTLADAVP